MYKIYFLRDSSTGQAKYVGRTSTSLSDRLSAHIYRAKNCESDRYDWLKDLLEKGLKPEIHLIEEIDDKEWEEKEKHWIKTLKLLGYDIENLTEGGEGSWGCFPSEETRKKMSESASNRNSKKQGPERVKRDILNEVKKSMSRPKIPKLVGNIKGQPPITQALEIIDPAKMKFAALVSNDWSLIDAFRESYPELACSKWVSRYAHRLAKDPKIREQVEELQQAMKVQFIINAPRALDRLEEIAENSDNARVKLDANVEILNRAGLQPPQRTEMLHVGLWGQMSAEDIRGIIRKNVDGLVSVREGNKV